MSLMYLKSLEIKFLNTLLWVNYIKKIKNPQIYFTEYFPSLAKGNVPAVWCKKVNIIFCESVHIVYLDSLIDYFTVTLSTITPFTFCTLKKIFTTILQTNQFRSVPLSDKNKYF